MSEEGKITTLCLITRNEGQEVLLAFKRQGFGAGQWNAYGGKPKAVDGGSIEKTLAREVEEESGLFIDPQGLQKVALIRFYFNGEFKWEMHTFLIEEWEGQPQDTKEMVSPTWHNTARLPWEKMWEGDPLWMPSVFAGEKVKCDIFYQIAGDGGKTVEKVIRYKVDF